MLIKVASVITMLGIIINRLEYFGYRFSLGCSCALRSVMDGNCGYTCRNIHRNLDFPLGDQPVAGFTGVFLQLGKEYALKQNQINHLKEIKMESYTYSNLFDTKGIEYIIIICFLLLLIPFWIIVNRKSSVIKQFQETVGALTAGVLRIPQGLFYSKNHTWLYLEKSGLAKIGIDDFLFRVLGEIKVHSLKSPGEKVRKGDAIATIEQDGKQLHLNSPVSGEMVGINSALAENNGVLPSDIYNEGWLFSIKPVNWKRETLGFYFDEEATRWISNELQRMKDFLSVALAKRAGASSAIVFQEGGEMQMNPLSGLEPEIWEEFQHEFLD